jgi:hypothetical protein
MLFVRWHTFVIQVGHFFDAGEAHGVYKWDDLVRCTISYDGFWELKSASYRENCKRNLYKAYAGRFYCLENIDGR